jgi:hypothetical protein
MLLRIDANLSRSKFTWLELINAHRRLPASAAIEEGRFRAAGLYAKAEVGAGGGTPAGLVRPGEGCNTHDENSERLQQQATTRHDQPP